MTLPFVGAVVLSFLYQQGCGSPVELTQANFEALALNGGKNAFVKFHAPWCGHCRNLAPTWDKLAEAHKDSKLVLIGDVDCTTDDGEQLCNSTNVKSYPTLLYFTRDTGWTGSPYFFGRNYEDMDKFVKNELVHYTYCNAKTKENCNDDQVAYISEQQGKTKDEWSAELTRLTDVKKYGTPYTAHPEYSECDVIDPGPQCNPMQTADLEPRRAFQCCNQLGEGCKGFLYVSSAAQKLRDGDDKASVYFCKGDGEFHASLKRPVDAVAYLKPAPEDELPESKPEAKTWLVQRLEMLESLIDEPKKQDEKEVAPQREGVGFSAHVGGRETVEASGDKDEL